MNKQCIFILGLLICACGAASAQSYKVSTIADSMKVNANVVVRLDEHVIEIKDLDRVDHRVHSVYTVLNKNGVSKLTLGFATSKVESLEEFNVSVFDANGVQTARYGRKDLFKIAFMGGLVEDGMHNILQIQPTSYPVTIDAQYELRDHSTFSYPIFEIDQDGESTENSSVTVKTPVEIGLRYDIRNSDLKPEMTRDGKYEVYNWSLKNLPAQKLSGDEGYYRRKPQLVLAPNKFQHYNTSGDMSSWESVGKWAFGLSQGLEKLPEARIEFFKTLVKDAKNDREKVALVYNYLQKNFRYVSIQLGIGGWKPFPAKFTDDKKYGDCKGLSFYMYSVLKGLGIKSYTALINSGYRVEPVNPAFPSARFNHVILCVPQQNDSIWLECTSNTADFAVLGGSTENRYALLLTENGGVLVPTPRSKSTSNIFRNSSKVNLTEDGSGNIHSLFLLKGSYRQILNEILTDKKDDQKTFITKLLSNKQPDEFSFADAGNTNAAQTVVDVQLEKIPQFTTGSKMFLNSKVYALFIPSVPKEKRNEDFYLQSPCEQYDSTVYTIPQGYTVDALPAGMESRCSFGEYTSKAWFDNDKHEVVTMTRFIISQNRVPAANYTEAKQFFDKILSDQQQKIVIARK